ncbi:MAG TPA: hypothetical protein VFW15_11200 [Thermoanaerobaculia bacterium]|nr:hypothetical protein [Thermoanaerobaculia bacterium]
MRRLLVFASVVGAALLILPNCRTTKHTVARIVTPVPAPTEVFVPAAPAPPTSTPVRPPAAPAARTAVPMPSPTPTVAVMRVVTPESPRPERSPGVLYEQYVPTVVAVTPSVTPVTTPAFSPSPRSTRPRRTPTPAATQKPGVYYEDEEGRPLPTPTP